MVFGCSLSIINPLEYVLINNLEFKVRPEIVHGNNDEPVFYTFGIKASKYSGSFNNTNDPYAKLCVTDVVENINITVFNLISRTIETRNVKWHACCKSKFRLDASVCNSK